jgi:aminomuconate-semialdehyde/2-hydroxymuconate-6-semialdehyde dehydrogenase
MVFGTGPDVGATLVKHPQVPLVSFTGGISHPRLIFKGTLTGEYIYAHSAPHFKKISLELGGKNANILFADCDIEKAVSTSIRSSFLNQGEICLCNKVSLLILRWLSDLCGT